MFFAANLLYVVLNTISKLVIAKTDNQHAAAFTTAITYGFYVLIIKQVADLAPTITITGTFITNLLGVYSSYWIMNKVNKKNDRLWKIEIYCPEPAKMFQLLEALNTQSISYKQNDDAFVTVYSYSHQDSKATKAAIKAAGEKVKYNVLEVGKTL